MASRRLYHPSLDDMSASKAVPLPEIGAKLSAFTTSVGRVQVHFGSGAIDELPELVAGLGGRRPLVVTDPGVRSALPVDAIADELRCGRLEVEIFDGVEENPTADHVETGRKRADAHSADLIVAIGGGSAMDAAKGINLLLTNGGRVEEYEGFGKARRPLLPSIGAPTTAGTGSEAQSYALLSRTGDHRKMACGDPGIRFREVVLDPDLVATAPRKVAFAAAIDALSHAIESLVCTRANPISRMYAREAFRHLYRHFETALTSPGDPEAAGRMLLGAHLAGAAIERSMLGAAHACANPLTAHFDIAHGLAVGMMLGPVVAYNRPVVGAEYDHLPGPGDDAGSLEGTLERLWRLGGVPGRLRDHGVPRTTLPELAREAAGQWTASFNPRPVDEAALTRIYESAY